MFKIVNTNSSSYFSVTSLYFFEYCQIIIKLYVTTLLRHSLSHINTKVHPYIGPSQTLYLNDKAFIHKSLQTSQYSIFSNLSYDGGRLECSLFSSSELIQYCDNRMFKRRRLAYSYFTLPVLMCLRPVQNTAY